MLIDLGLNRHLREKRVAVRIAVKARVCLSHSTFGVIHSHTRDISDSGVFVEVTDKLRLPVGAHVKLQMLDSARPEIDSRFSAPRGVLRRTRKARGRLVVIHDRDLYPSGPQRAPVH